MSPAPVARGLIDTPILVGYRNGVPGAVQLMAALRQFGLPDISQLSAMGLIARCQDASDRNGVEAFLKISTVHKVSAPIARRAQAILETISPACALSADDAIIAATAIEHKLPFYTLGPTRFAGIGGLTAIRLS